MQTKLTLRLDEELITAAKTYAKESGKSVSQLFADYIRGLKVLNRSSQDDTDDFDLDQYPITKSLVGLLKGVDYDEEDYYRYLEEKHR